jgi:hypothetical protein
VIYSNPWNETFSKAGMVINFCNPSTLEVEAGELGIQGQSSYIGHIVKLSQKQKNRET